MTENHRNSHKINLQWCFLIGVGIFMCLSTVQAMSECGLVQNSGIRNGSEVLRDGWPFIAALYEKPNRFLCSGTIISEKHVLTTAQCVHLKNSSTRYGTTEIIVRLGTAEIEDGVQNRNVAEIHVHEDWEPYGDRSNADIAVVVLSIDVTFNEHIQPICLPADDVVTDDIEGHIIGWGNAENETTQEILAKSVSRVLNDSNCYPNESSIGRNSSIGSFCAGYGSGEVLNITDNGAGFFVLSQSHWVQFGIITTTQTNGTGHVSPQSAAAFTNVKLFTTWIKSIVEMNDWEIVRCWIGDKDMYTCRLAVVHGTKLRRNAWPNFNGKTNDDVGVIYIPNFIEFPTRSKIGQTFPNLKVLRIIDRSCDDRLEHIISSRNFENMENLIELKFDFAFQWLCFVPVELDFLKNFPNLEKISSSDKKINCTVNETTFQANSRLKEVELDIEGSIPWNLFQKNLMLESVGLYVDVIDIDERIFEANVKLRDFFLSGGTVKSLPWNLFKNNLMLEEVHVMFTSITEIDERTFETNEKLKRVLMYYCRLEFLPRDLFKNNLLLQHINFNYNQLKIIEIDFTALKSVQIISLLGNSCISSRCSKYEGNLNEFQRNINSSCIANSSSLRI